MTLQEYNKKKITYYLKQNSLYENIFISYKNNETTKIVMDGVLNSLFPSCILENYGKSLGLNYRIIYDMIGYIKTPNKSYRTYYDNLIHKSFIAKNYKDKAKLKQICKKYGILHYRQNLSKIIDENERFYLTYENMIETLSDKHESDISLSKFIYEYEKIANEINGIKLSINEKLKNYFKYIFNL